MSYRIGTADSSRKALRRIAREEIAAARIQLEGAATGRTGSVHQVRKRCKRLRALLALYAGSLHEASAAGRVVRDAARLLAGARDAEVLLALHTEIVHASPGLAAEFDGTRLRALLERQVRDGQAQLRHRAAVAAAALAELERGVRDWRPTSRGFAVLAGGLRASVERSRRAMQLAHDDTTSEHVHAWRKRAKEHWYHLRLLEPLWPEGLRGSRRCAKAIGDDLGAVHDLFALDQFVRANCNGAAVRYTACIRARRERLWRRAHATGRVLFAEEPDAVVARFASYWRARGAARHR